MEFIHPTTDRLLAAWVHVVNGEQITGAITTRNLSFRYSRAPEPVLKGIDLEIEPGCCVAVWGSAKSTLLMALGGVIPHLISGHMEGEVFVEGLDTRSTPLRELAKRVGVVLQDPENQLFNLTVEHDVVFGMENLRVPREEMDRRLERVLDLVGLTPLRHRPSSQLSGGQKQRASIAAVLAVEPKILILDEPTRELDPLGTEEVFRVLRRLKEDGVTIVLVENDPGQIAPLADRVLFLDDGRVSVDAPPRQFYRELREDTRIRMPQVTEAFFRAPPPGEQDVPLTVEEGEQTYGG
jgi:energy-coupling factor transporter ATP-binding protein EcfA2